MDGWQDCIVICVLAISICSCIAVVGSRKDRHHTGESHDRS